MTSIIMIGIVVWLIGAVVAWNQIRRWNKDVKFIFPHDYIILTVVSISLSWLIYPIRMIDGKF